MQTQRLHSRGTLYSPIVENILPREPEEVATYTKGHWLCVIVSAGDPMVASPRSESEVYQFIRERIESVPHLEAMLLLWNSRPQPWSLGNLAKRLYVSEERVRLLLADLVREELVIQVAGAPDYYGYNSVSTEQDGLIAAVDSTYRRELVRIATLIHSRPPSAVRDFARAFRFKKERE